MNQAKYKNQQIEMKKKKILLSIFILIVFFIVCLILMMSIQNKNEEKQDAIASGNFNSIKDILEYYGCECKKVKQSDDEEFLYDIYTVFKYELYNGEESNEKFYTNIINDIAKFLNYKSFKLIDTEKSEKIEIEVICKNNDIKKVLINGIEDYFIYMDSKINLSKYKEIQLTDVLVQSQELINCIQNDWNSTTDFGTRESIFQKYYIYADEGIKTRTINGEIYNIVFTENYLNPVINNFHVGVNKNDVISKMGKPTFQNDDKTIIGYKSNEIYVFFEDNEISIYRNITNIEDKIFFDLADKYFAEEITFLEFMNELTYQWPDYEEYIYDRDFAFLSYPNKGIDVKLNYDNMNAFVLYNNVCINQDLVKEYLEHTEFVAQLQVDNVYNAEVRRVEKEKELISKCEEFQETYEKDDDRNRGKIYNYYGDIDSHKAIKAMYFIAQQDGFVNAELIENISSYIWITDYCIVYSKEGKGIFYYDLRSRNKGTLISGNEIFEIISYENGILKYDDKEVNITIN